jgi:alpha-L-fucosidase 2
LEASHRHFSHLMALHPLGLIDVADGPEARRIVDASLRDLDRHGTDWWCGYSYAWLGNLAARTYDGPKAERALEIFSTAFTLRNSFHCNGDQSGKGFSRLTYRPFTLEGNFAMAAGLQEMLIQSHRGPIEVFPAIPPAWKDLEFHNLRAQGAVLVSAQRQNGVVTRVVLRSEQGGACQLLSPFTGRALNLWLRPRQPLVLTQDPPQVFSGS